MPVSNLTYSLSYFHTLGSYLPTPPDSLAKLCHCSGQQGIWKVPVENNPFTYKAKPDQELSFLPPLSFPPACFPILQHENNFLHVNENDANNESLGQSMEGQTVRLSIIIFPSVLLASPGTVHCRIVWSYADTLPLFFFFFFPPFGTTGVYPLSYFPSPSYFNLRQVLAKLLRACLNC